MSVAAVMGLSAGLAFLGQLFGAKTAAKAQTDAANAGIAAQLAMFGITRESLQPFISGGTDALDKLWGTPAVEAQAAKQQLPWLLSKGGETKKLGFQATAADVKKLTDQGWKVTQTGQAHADAVAGQAATTGRMEGFMQPIKIDLAALEKTPGYKFTQAQGLKGVGNQLTQGGLGRSGSAIKGAETFAAGLASQTFQQEFARRMAQREMKYNMLTGQAQLGEAAAAGLGTGAMGAGSSVAQSLANIGSAQAGAATSIGSAAGDFGSGITASALFSQLLQSKNAGVEQETAKQLLGQ